MSKAKTSKTATENRLLEERIPANQVVYSRQVLLGVGCGTAFLPAYLAHSVKSLEWTSLVNLPFFLIVPIITGIMLARAYASMIESEFWKRQKNYEVKGVDESLLRKLYLQVAFGYTVFFVNLFFLIVSTLLQAYILRNIDARAGYFIASTIAAASVWLLAQKNEESRQRRIRGGQAL
eukprot:GILJ01026690.1.p1 GENE.GILJ01026690.1~~GILJ01026690.1.p1  ORF type:complete len:178 (+),score=34.23 GILJ01026690.1:50-583(+)